MNQLRRIFGWSSLAVFSAISVLHAIDYTCPGATDLVLENGTCQLQGTDYVCVAKENSVTFRSCVPNKATTEELGSCPRQAGAACFVTKLVEFKADRRCSSDETSDKRPVHGEGLILAQSVPCE
jgi:hypothetical protein